MRRPFLLTEAWKSRWRGLKNLLFRRPGLFACLGILAAKALDSAGGVNQFLLAGEERVAVGADFYVHVAFMGGASRKAVTACTQNANLMVGRMDGCFHSSPVVSNV
jgi:hypothetical protein